MRTIELALCMLMFGTTMNCSRTKPASANTSTQQFPGFALTLVSGERTQDGNDYRQGSVVVTSHHKPVMISKIKWRSANQLANLDDIARTYTANLGETAKYKLVHHEGQATAEIATNDMTGVTVWLTVLRCGNRDITLETLADMPAPLRLHDVALRSFDCHPDAAAEAAGPTLPVVFDKADLQLTTTQPYSTFMTADKQGQLIVISDPPNPSLDETAAARATLASLQLGDTATVGTPTEGTFPFTRAAVPIAFVRFIHCPDATVRLLGSVAMPEAYAPLLATAQQARCSQPGARGVTSTSR